jgi:hypothetical protein
MDDRRFMLLALSAAVGGLLAAAYLFPAFLP